MLGAGRMFGEPLPYVLLVSSSLLLQVMCEFYCMKFGEYMSTCHMAESPQNSLIQQLCVDYL